MDWANIGEQLFLAALFTFFGLALFFVSYHLLARVTPFDLHKELAEDDNTAVGVMVGGMFIGIGIIIGAAIV